MKYLLAFHIVLFGIPGYSQNIGDTLFAARKSGVTVYEKPDINSAPIANLPINSEIVIKAKLELDTSELRIGNWYKIKTNNDKAGYAFGGFFNRLKILTNLATLDDAIQSLESQYINLFSSSHETSRVIRGTMDLIVHIHGSRFHTRIDEIFWEGEATELFFFDIDVYEMLNIIENINQEVSSSDYTHIISSQNREELTKFHWTSGENDPGLPEVTLEKLAKGGIRIYIVAGL